MVQLSLSHSQARGAFCSSADVSIAYRYWVKHPVLLDSRPADCVTTSASNTGCFAMSKKNGKPCRKCGANEWNTRGDCKVCARELTRRYRQENPDRVLENNRRYYQEHAEEAREYSKQYRREHPETVLKNRRLYEQRHPEKQHERILKYQQNHTFEIQERSRRHYLANVEKKLESARRWRASHPEAQAANDHRRRARETTAGGSFSAAEWKACQEHYGNKCLCCGRVDMKLTADHVVPVSKGGTSNIENIQPLCASCNSRKGAKTIDYRPGKGLGRWVQRKLFG